MLAQRLTKIAAVAERLWCGGAGDARELARARLRLSAWRCRALRRGVAGPPVLPDWCPLEPPADDARPPAPEAALHGFEVDAEGAAPACAAAGRVDAPADATCEAEMQALRDSLWRWRTSAFFLAVAVLMLVLSHNVGWWLARVK